MASSELIMDEEEQGCSCKNCATTLNGSYCSDCGQKNKPLDPTLHDLLHEALHEFVHLDGKIVSTLKALFFYPGRLTLEFFEGKRARHIGPLRLYLTASLIFFLLAAHQSGSHSGIQLTDKKDEAEMKKELKDVPEPPSFDISIGPKDGQANKTATHWKDRIIHAAAHPDEFKHLFLSSVSKVMFFIVPLFALGLRLAYHNRKINYPSYIYFSVHYHSFVFLALSLYMLGGLTHWHFLEHLLGWCATIGLPVYLFMAMRRVFGGSRGKTLFRMAALMCFYFPCLLLGVTVAAAIALSSV